MNFLAQHFWLFVSGGCLVCAGVCLFRWRNDGMRIVPHTYKLRTTCLKCQSVFKVEIPYGQDAKDHSTRCPDCGTRSRMWLQWVNPSKPRWVCD